MTGWKFNVELLEGWIQSNRPNAEIKLSRLTGGVISAGGVRKLRREGHMPRPQTLQSLAEAMGFDTKDFVLEIRLPRNKRAG